MKKLKCVFLVLVLLLCTGCENKEEKKPEPESSQVKSICELATMDCYYHNVAKFYEEDASGILLWKKDKNFWIEYAGVVRVGIDASRVTIDVEDTTVTISIPSAQVLGCTVDETTLTKDSFIIADDSAKITAEDQTAAFKVAQENMYNDASNDTTILANAQQRAQKLLEDYVNNLGNSVGVEYTIKWVYLDDANGVNAFE